MSEASREARQTEIDDMRKVLDFLEANPDIGDPYLTSIDIFAEAEDIKTIAKALGKADKKILGSTFMLVKKFGTMKLEVNFERNQVCERRVVGTKEIEEQIIPARVVDVVEWDCPESILGMDDA